MGDLRPIIGLDTETDDKGNLRIIADSDQRHLTKITPKTVFKWLFHKKYQFSLNFFYNIGFDAEIILKLLPKDILDNYKESRILKFDFDGYTIEYIPRKKLSIRKGHHSTIFFDVAQFYFESLPKAYEHNIGKLPDKYLEMKSKRSSFSNWYYKQHMKQIRDYCIQDCILTKELAEHWVDLFYEAFSFYPARWISSAYLAEKVLYYNRIHIPKFNEIPYDVQELATNCYFGGRFEILKRGYIGQSYLYDINSAYPFALTKVPELTKGKWIQQNTINQKSLLGFFKIKVNIPDLKFVPPFAFRKNNMVCYPSGEFTTFATLEELKAVNEPKYYNILNSWQYLDDNPTYPYKNFIENIYTKRLELKKRKDPLQLPLKIILNSIYGKTGEIVRGRIGNIFNPVIFSFITGHARAHLYNFVKEHNIENDVVAFATDSICTTKKLDINSEKLGEFSLDKEGSDVFYLQNGFYRFNGKWKQRGLGSLGSKEIEHLNTIERDGRLFMKFKVNRPQRLRSAILMNIHDDIGKFSEFEREVDLNADKKRMWIPAIGIKSIDTKKMNVSVPLNLGFLTKSQL